MNMDFLANMDFKVPFEETLDGTIGLEYRSYEDDQVTAVLHLRKEYFSSPGRLHLGAAAIVAESIASAGTAAKVIPNGLAAMGKWNETTAVGTVSGGELLNVVGTVVAKNPDEWLWDIRCEDESGQLVATSRVAIAVRPLQSPSRESSASPEQ
jgi:uncharacterized protein (TIGR00369 family)